MVSCELKKIVFNLNKLGKTWYAKAATESDITDFEKKNAIRFPAQYKTWLLFSDGGELFLPAGVQFYGVAHKPLINPQDDDKPDDKYIVIGALATGDPILCEKSGNAVAIYNHEAGRIEEDELFPDFFTFLEQLSDILGIRG